MLTEELMKLLESLQQKHLTNRQAVPDQYEKGYGLTAEAEVARKAFFKFGVQGSYRFDEPRKSQQVMGPKKCLNR